MTAVPAGEVRYISTRGGGRPLGFEDALLTGLAEDGGLLVPDSLPRFSAADFAAMAGMRYEEVAARIVAPFVGSAFSPDELSAQIGRAYAGFAHPERCPLVEIGDGLHLLELFHGPTLAFKDFALQLVGQMFASVLERRGERVAILGATSGDTGSAAIEAFRGQPSVDVFILYPRGRVSDVQRRQMTTPDDGNVRAIAVDGDFDDCQARVKDMFNDARFKAECGLGAVNSINWARIVGQVVYYVAAALKLGAPERRVSFAVPTGNFGDIYAGRMARGIGLPVADLVVATNSNDILHRALSGGAYRKGRVEATISPSMDIQVSSNFERALFDACEGDAAAVRGLMRRLDGGGFDIPAPALGRLRRMYRSGRCGERETRERIARTWKETGRLVCPHTAVGIEVALQEERDRAVPMVALATAHPAKFADAVARETGVQPQLPAHLAGIGQRPERIANAPNDSEALKDLIRGALRK